MTWSHHCRDVLGRLLYNVHGSFQRVRCTGDSPPASHRQPSGKSLLAVQGSHITLNLTGLALQKLFRKGFDLVTSPILSPILNRTANRRMRPCIAGKNVLVPRLWGPVVISRAEEQNLTWCSALLRCELGHQLSQPCQTYMFQHTKFTDCWVGQICVHNKQLPTKESMLALDYCCGVRTVYISVAIVPWVAGNQVQIVNPVAFLHHP